jgi:TonB-dependent SusC/RagA subfamily outer membrane receptor
MVPELVEISSTDIFLNIVLQQDIQALDELIVVGYGTQKKESVVGAIGTAKGEDLKTQGNVSNLRDALTGTIPGMTVLASSGLAGGGDENISKETEILIRGKTTWNNSSPLILVDGIERDMDDIDINEVESISVLKDASATAVFGVKGGNGVILITTKRGRTGKAQFYLKTLTNHIV